MGMEYGLYHRESKTFIWLGKKFGERFQIENEKIAGFLAGLGSLATVEIHNDCGDPPDYHDDSWKRLANWCEDDEDDEVLP